jgi:membrane protein required for beta-lactamase induction
MLLQHTFAVLFVLFIKGFITVIAYLFVTLTTQTATQPIVQRRIAGYYRMMNRKVRERKPS